MEEKKGLAPDRKFLLTVDEANEYFGIGTTKIRQMLRKPGCNFVLRVGHNIKIKRTKMEKYLEDRVEI